MKKIINFKKIVLSTLLLVFGTTPMCFADVYSSPMDDFVIAIPFLGIILTILVISLFIDLVCMIVGKINNSEELISKTKRYAESLFYYILIILVLMLSVTVFVYAFIFSIIPFIVIFVSLYLRLKKQNKKAAYLPLGILLAIIFIIFLLPYIPQQRY